MVDSTPTATAPPSTIRSIRPARSLSTWAAVVGDTWPDRLADGATTGPPKARRMARATRVGGQANRHGIEPGGGEIGHRAVSGFGQNQRQRPGPERLGQPHRRRIESRDAPGGGEIADMGDQRVEGGAALGLVEPRDRLGIGRHRRPAHKPSRWGTRPARLAPGSAPPRSPRLRRRAGSAFSASHSQRSISSITLLAVCETRGYKPPSCRSVAQPGRALRSGRRGRRFESCHSDQEINDLAKSPPRFADFLQ